MVSFSSLKLNTDEIKQTGTEHILSHWSRIPTLTLTTSINYFSMTFKIFSVKTGKIMWRQNQTSERVFTQEHVRKWLWSNLFQTAVEITQISNAGDSSGCEVMTVRQSSTWMFNKMLIYLTDLMLEISFWTPQMFKDFQSLLGHWHTHTHTHTVNWRNGKDMHWNELCCSTLEQQNAYKCVTWVNEL